jgi:hypothetical protein
LTRLRDLFPDKRSQRLWANALALQQEYLKDRGLMPYFSGADPSAEFSGPFGQPFAPRLPFKMGWLLKDATAEEVEEVTAGPVALLHEYGRRMHDIVGHMRLIAARRYVLPKRRISGGRGRPADFEAELTDALDVTALRAGHRALTLQALIASRRSGTGRGDTGALLAKAADERGRAMDIVRRQEQRYRYSRDLIASRREDFTAYHFGYLYPVSELHFWNREEEQVRNKRFDALFMNIWNFRRVVGIESLVW